ncbi:MAG: DNA mismatch repair endonuclease MutL, partial [Erysipelotrichales bacterium]|nr:DNA mismatch repair endonuclease MutL [Erysipelotrichales bacterium]
MGNVHILDTNIANRIAAGEVVERPSGVVKELVENSIDAGATRIEVRIKQGGIEEIQVIDNGCGMDREDALLAFERHATSKISKESDLWNIHTLGFRGEALPSIASVSDVELTTCNGEVSTHIRINNGKLLESGSGVFRQGTHVIVRELFYAIPARLKHLKAIPYETSQVSDIITKLALANPNIAFVLYSDDKEVFRSSGNHDYTTLLYAVYGKEVAKAAVPLEVSDDDFKISGYICLPTVTRSNRKHIMTFMNTRLVVSYYLQSAILNGYQEYIPEKRYPMVFVNIEMSANLVDVNVHPSKWEVRLSKEKQLYGLLENAIKDTLRMHMHKQGSLISDPIWKEESVLSGYVPKIEQPALFDKEYKSSIVADSAPIEVKIELPKPVIQEQYVENTEVFVEKKVTNVEKEPVIVEKTEGNVEKLAQESVNEIPFEVIGQLHGSYILASNVDGLVIIDQHAANERIRYEEVRKALEESQIAVQPLLMPYVISISRSMMLHYDQLESSMQTLGFTIDRFGETEILVREVPLW